MRKINFLLLALLALFTAQALKAQTYTRQVIIVSGGNFTDPDDYVKVGSFNPATGVYTAFDSVKAASTKSVVISDGYAYVSADSLLMKYDLGDLSRQATGHSIGLQYLAAYGNYILATRAYVDSGYVQVFNKSDLSLVKTISGISDEAAGIAVVGDSAYVAVPGAYGKDTGTVAVIDLANLSLKREIFLDTMGSGIGRVFANGNDIYTLSANRSVLTHIDAATGQFTHTLLPFGTYAATGLFGDSLLLDMNFSALGAYDVASSQIIDSNIVDYNGLPGLSSFSAFVAGTAFDYLNKRVYVTTTDYNTMGQAFVADLNGNILDTFDVGVSAEAMAVDYSTPTSVAESTAALKAVVYPNPATTQIQLLLQGPPKGRLTITDISGKEIYTAAFSGGALKIDVKDYPKGIYLLRAYTAEGTYHARFIKQ